MGDFIRLEGVNRRVLLMIKCRYVMRMQIGHSSAYRMDYVSNIKTSPKVAANLA